MMQQLVSFRKSEMLADENLIICEKFANMLQKYERGR